ncbi:helix-turn-helix transcriptional regulator [Hydrogenophaga sp. H7]|uniref:ArsR/SmtB family transcription factor n=1 Tax=Hydrogenophaga sp. H7 TaxID=1882399 RepID=UPI0009A3A3CC|nr:metalloregulator ArsR/SmtB family transcription factor [Hydrogenophaga sp. H7]OPF64792.1 transcriptional regulator [Hydrogenophaga sp. H7]
MEETEVVRALGALAQETRLRIFRLLVVAGPEGLNPGHMAEQLGIASTALSFHLKELSHSGLIASEREGRNLFYRASIPLMNDLLAYLTAHCCQGQACLETPTKLDCDNC